MSDVAGLTTCASHCFLCRRDIRHGTKAPAIAIGCLALSWQANSMFTSSGCTYGAMCLAPRLSPDRQFIGPQIIEALRDQDLKDPPCRGSQCCSVLVSRMGFNGLSFALGYLPWP